MPDKPASATEGQMNQKLLCTVCSVDMDDSVELTYHYLKHSLLELAQALTALQVERFSKTCDAMLNKEQSLSGDVQFMKTIKKEEEKRLEKFTGKKVTPSREPQQCDKCKKVLSSRSNLKKHMIMHVEQKPFSCDECPAEFNQNRDLKTHKMQKHSQLRPHLCKICGKGFVHKFYLEEHMAYHTGEKNHQCFKCGKRFPAPSALNKHMKRHTLTKEFKCDVCSKMFAVNTDLKAHLKLVHERPSGSKGIPLAAQSNPEQTEQEPGEDTRTEGESTEQELGDETRTEGESTSLQPTVQVREETQTPGPESKGGLKVNYDQGHEGQPTTEQDDLQAQGVCEQEDELGDPSEQKVSKGSSDQGSSRNTSDQGTFRGSFDQQDLREDSNLQDMTNTSNLGQTGCEDNLIKACDRKVIDQRDIVDEHCDKSSKKSVLIDTIETKASVQDGIEGTLEQEPNNQILSELGESGKEGHLRNDDNILLADDQFSESHQVKTSDVKCSTVKNVLSKSAINQTVQFERNDQPRKDLNSRKKKYHKRLHEKTGLKSTISNVEVKSSEQASSSLFSPSPAGSMPPPVDQKHVIPGGIWVAVTEPVNLLSLSCPVPRNSFPTVYTGFQSNPVVHANKVEEDIPALHGVRRLTREPPSLGSTVYLDRQLAAGQAGQQQLGHYPLTVPQYVQPDREGVQNSAGGQNSAGVRRTDQKQRITVDDEIPPIQKKL